MLQAKDLRVGNLVCYYNDGTVFEVIEIHATGIRVKNEEQETWIEYDCFSPIPLDAEWLKKFGAQGHDKKLLFLALTNLKSEFHFEIYEKEIVTTIKGDFGELILDPIKWVHSLQNIYHGLSNGQGLPIKYNI